MLFSWNIILFCDYLKYIEPVKRWAELHTSGGTPCPCTCVGTWADDTIVTGGEDGRITLLSPGHNAAVRILGMWIIEWQMWFISTVVSWFVNIVILLILKETDKNKCENMVKH